MSNIKKILCLFIVVLLAYSSAWMKAYFLSKSYFEYAQQQQESGNLTLALKGMNKLELRIEDEYLGGYQQIIETWESSVFGIKPDFYYTSLNKPKEILTGLTQDELFSMIDVYIQLDSRYVPDAAYELMYRAGVDHNDVLEGDMHDFLTEAFPNYLVMNQ